MLGTRGWIPNSQADGRSRQPQTSRFAITSQHYHRSACTHKQSQTQTNTHTLSHKQTHTPTQSYFSTHRSMSQKRLYKIHTGACIGGISKTLKNEAAVHLCTSKTGWATNKLSSVHVNLRLIREMGVLVAALRISWRHCILVQLAQHSHWSRWCFAALLRHCAWDRTTGTSSRGVTARCITTTTRRRLCSRGHLCRCSRISEDGHAFHGCDLQKILSAQSIRLLHQASVLAVLLGHTTNMALSAITRKQYPGHRLADTEVRTLQQRVQCQSMSSFFNSDRMFRSVVCTSRRCLRSTSTATA